MKKLCVVLLFFATFGCASDDNGLTVNEENLIGKWYFAGEKINGAPYFEYQNLCETSRDYMELKSDATGIIFEYETNCTPNNGNEPAEWCSNGVAFTFTDYDPAASFEGLFKVVKLTADELVLQEGIEDGQSQLVLTYFTKN